ncbi:hypothetical protein CTAYLR_008440 [Chrysophaeum taylorii]|uniref:CSD domain-containing protein n=1 Tax=Chrysophaeum taylorii TaxID=2483200 RepID=A0AAD7UJV8_9STRA|nr:hypothetical protein CTAYLR_008440 [Chrysophaeum taylorii]
MPNQRTRERKRAQQQAEEAPSGDDSRNGESGSPPEQNGEAETSTSTNGPTSSEQRQTGVCRWYKEAKRFGFISSSSGTDIFVHAMDLKDVEIGEGDTLEYSVVHYKGKPKAIDVVKVKSAENGKEEEEEGGEEEEKKSALVDNVRRTGVTAWYTAKKKHGFIKPDEPGQRDIFVHALDLRDGQLIGEGDRVEYSVANYQDKIKAVDVVKLAKPPAAAAPASAAKKPAPPRPRQPDKPAPAPSASGGSRGAAPWASPAAKKTTTTTTTAWKQPDAAPAPAPAADAPEENGDAPGPAPAPAPAPA